MLQRISQREGVERGRGGEREREREREREKERERHGDPSLWWSRGALMIFL